MSNHGGSDLLRPGDTAGRIFDDLIAGILDGRFQPGAVLREARLALEWGVSRTPLREAIRRAAEAGFIVLRPNRAPVVRILDRTDVDGLYDLRGLLECHALELAWPRLDQAEILRLVAAAAALDGGSGATWRQKCLTLDRDLHSLWVDRCGNSWLRADLAKHHDFLRIFQRWVGRDDAALAQALDEHATILTALAAGDRRAARSALAAHIAHSAAAVTAALARQPPTSAG